MTGEPHEFKQTIKRAREHCGLSLSEAAELIGVAKNHVWELEQGRTRNPTIQVLAGIAVTYDIDLGVLAHLAAAAAPGTDFRLAVQAKRKADLKLVSLRAASMKS